MTFSSDTQRTIILFFILILFLFVFFYYWNSSAESFDTISSNVAARINDDIWINTNLHSLKNTWFNSKNTNTDIRIPWRSLKWKGNPSQLPYHNTNMTVSFWIYLHDLGTNWQAVFRVVDPGNSERVPGVWLLSRKRSGLHIRQSTNRIWNNGRGNEHIYCKISQYIPVFVTIVFSEGKYTLYIDGQYQTEYSWNGKAKNIKSPDQCYIQIGNSSHNNYVLQNVAIQEDILTADQVSELYKTSLEQLGPIEVAISNARKALGMVDTVEEGFTSTIGGSLAGVVNFQDQKVVRYTGIKNEIESTGESESTGTSEDYIVNDSNKTLTEVIVNSDKRIKTYRLSRYYKEFINVTPNVPFGPSGATFALWFYCGNGNKIWPRLFDFGNGPSRDNVIMAFYDKSLRCVVINSSGYSVQREVAFDLHYKWYHIVWSMHPNGNWKIYINGFLQKSYGDMKYPDNVERKNQYIGMSNWYQYQADNNRVYDQIYNGYIGDFRVITHEVTPDQAKYIYNNPM